MLARICPWRYTPGMREIGTPYTDQRCCALLLGSGELGKELAIELQRFGVEVVAVDRYENAPAMHVAHRSHVISMLDAVALRRVIEEERPDLIIPELEAIATDTLLELEQEGFNVVPTALATRLTMDREGIRRLAAEQLGLATSPYRFVDSIEELHAAVDALRFPCVVKPVMSSSGKGQSVVRSVSDIASAWHCAQSAGRAGAGRLIVESFVDFDFEITLLTVRYRSPDGTAATRFCAPIGHRQIDGDYRESWQPQPMSSTSLRQAEEMAEAVTAALGGWGLFGVEFFVKGDRVIFSELSPRPHDTGMVTMISQELSEFALHARAVLGLPIPHIRAWGPAASAVILGEGESDCIRYAGLGQALADADTQVRLFGKPSLRGRRRLGVALALGKDIDEARSKALRAAEGVQVLL